MQPFSQKQGFAKRDIAIQADSVRQTWGLEPIDCELRIRLGEELEYACRMLDLTGYELSDDPIAVARHVVSLQYLDKACQILGHIANVMRSTNPQSAVEGIAMGDLKARLMRRGAL